MHVIVDHKVVEDRIKMKAYEDKLCYHWPIEGNMGDVYCHDCDAMLHPPTLRGRIGFWWRCRVRKVDDFRAWLRCDECGMRFGKHDEEVEHSPF